MSIIPVGVIDNFASFVALMGRRFPITALMDGAQSTRQYQRVMSAAKGSPGHISIIVCGELLADLPKTADIEDLFEVEDYLWLYERAVGPLPASDPPAAGEPILKPIEAVRGKFDHALPAHTLTKEGKTFLSRLQPKTLDRFGILFEKLAQTLSI